MRKRSASVFGSTAIASVLNQLRIDTVIIAGESTSGCVRAAVVDARDLRYPVVVPEECVFDRTEASHAINLYDMHRKYAHVIPLSETLEYLAGVADDAGAVVDRARCRTPDGLDCRHDRMRLVCYPDRKRDAWSRCPGWSQVVEVGTAGFDRSTTNSWEVGR